jgi:LPXTG-motif cell wall-anchored protein
VAVAGLLLSVIATGGQAGAQTAGTPASYTGSATGYALALTLANQGLTAGSSAAKAASTGAAGATGAGVLGQANTTATAAAGETKPEVCGDSQLDAVEAAVRNLVTLGLACGSASATGSGATTGATASGKVAKLDVNLAGPLSALPIPTASVVQPISGGLDQLCAALPAQLQPVACAAGNTVQTVLQSITTTSAVGAEIGSSTSGVAVAGETVTTESTASGAIIRIVPTPVLDGVTLPEALATITVSRANAKVLCALGSGQATPSFDPAIVRVKLAGPLAALLAPLAGSDPIPLIGIPVNPILNQIISGGADPTVTLQNGELTVTPGASVVLFAGTPIETQIVVGAGSSTVNPDGSASAVADGVRIHALRNIGTAVAPLTGGLLANLAHAEAAGACVAATTVTNTPAVPDVTRELPRTGGSDVPWLPAAGVAGLALAVFTRRAVLRTR